MTRTRIPAPRDEAPVVVLALALIALVVAGVAAAIDRVSYDVGVAALLGVLIVALSVPILRRLAADDGSLTFRILLVGLLLKLVFAIVRYVVMSKVYGATGDSGAYDSNGWLFAQAVRHGDLSPRVPAIDQLSDGTRRITLITGYLYAVIGHSKHAGFLFFSWLSFWGAVLFHRGARRGFPELDQRRYLILLMFFPSLLFWPSSIGKDAVMLFFLGLGAYGASLLLGPRVRMAGAVPVAAAIGGMLLIRPHIALMLVFGLAAAALAAAVGGRRMGASSGRRQRAVRLATLVVVAAGALVAVSQSADYFTRLSGGDGSAESALDETARRTSTGGSQFEAVRIRTPADLPAGTMSVLFRPFPWEAGSGVDLVASGESLLLLVMVVLSWRRLLRWPGSALRRPYLVFASAYIFLFVVAFSTISNIGILARQRTQLLPFVLLILALPTGRWWAGPPDGSAEIHPTRRPRSALSIAR